MLITHESKANLKLGGLYALVNLSNGKVYIGRTWKFSKRFSEHRYRLTSSKTQVRYYSSDLQNDYQRGDQFEFQILLIVDDQAEVFSFELMFMALFASIDPNYGYNQTFSALSPTRETLKAWYKNAENFAAWYPKFQTGREKVRRLFKDSRWYENWYQRTIIEGQAPQAGAAGLKRRLESDPAYAKKHSETASKNLEERWQDPKEREKGLTHIEFLHTDPEIKKKHQIGVKRQANAPEGKKVRSNNMYARWADPEWKERARQRCIEMNRARKGRKDKPEARLKKSRSRRAYLKRKALAQASAVSASPVLALPVKQVPSKKDELAALWGESI